MTFGRLLREWRFWAGTIAAVAIGGVATAAAADRFDERALALAIPLLSVLLLIPLATVIDLRWRAWPTALLVAGAHLACWWLLTAGFLGWTDAEWLDGRGFSAGSPGAVSTALAVVCCLSAVPLTASTLLAPGLTLTSGDENPVSVARRLIGMPLRVAGGLISLLIAVSIGAVVATYGAILIVFLGGGPVGLAIALVIAVAGVAGVGAFIATSLVWLAEQRPDTRLAPVRVVIAGVLLAVAAAGVATGRSLDYTEINGPLTQVEQDPMTSFSPAGGRLKSEIRTKRKAGGGAVIDRAGTMYERKAMVLRSFLVGRDASPAAAEAAQAARAAGWTLTEEDDPYSSAIEFTGARIQDGTAMKLSITGSGPLQCPLSDPNPLCHSGELRVEVSADWELEPEAKELASDPMATFIPPGTTAGRSDTYPTNLTREYYVPKPASDQAVIDAAAATAAAAQTNGWTQTVTGANLWVGEKRDGDQLLRLRIDTDLLVGASGTYVDDKAGFVKVLIMKVDR